MNAFVPLETSIFAPDFTLDPYPWLEDLYPGVNLDPTHWDNPLELSFDRQFTHDNHNIFGGSRYSCIGSRIALKYFSELVPLILEYLPITAEIASDDITVDGDWITERVITNLPIVVPEQ